MNPNVVTLTKYKTHIEISTFKIRDFQGWLTLTKNLPNRKWDGVAKVWTVPVDLDLQRYKEALKNELGINVEERENTGKLDVKREIAAGANKVHVERFGETYAIYHPFSPALNDAYRDAEKFSGIARWVPEKKARCVLDVFDLVEALDVIKTTHPDWELPDINDLILRDETLKAESRKMPEAWCKIYKTDISLLPHQVEGIKKLLQFDGNTLVGDDMGLGKTLQVLSYAELTGKKLLVVCPKNVRRQWIHETAKFFRRKWKCQEIDTKTEGIDNEADLLTINYEILHKFADKISSENRVLVMDESHRIKNPKANITQLILGLSQIFEKKILMSGTPIKNKKHEMFCQVKAIRPGTFSSADQMKSMPVFDLREKMKDFFFRRTKKQELKNLPEKTRQTIDLIDGKLPDLFFGMTLGDLAHIKSQLAQEKVLKHSVPFVEDVLENTESKVLLFTDSSEAAKIAYEKLGEIAVLHIGETAHDKREIAKERFQTDPSVRVFIATTGSAREGLNLTAADRVVFNDLPWTPADLCQAEDRCYRIGQKNCVNVYWLVDSANAFDSRLLELIQRKMSLYKLVIDGKQLTPEEKKVFNSKIDISDYLRKEEHAEAESTEETPEESAIYLPKTSQL